MKEFSYSGDIIPRKEIEQLYQAQFILDEARVKAKKIIDLAKSRLIKTKSNIEKMLLDSKKKAEQDAIIIAENATDEAIANTIEWIVNEKSLEQCIVANIEEKIRKLVAQAIIQYSAQQDTSDILIRQLSKPIEEQLMKGNVQLKVNSQILPKIELKLSKGSGLELVADDSLSTNQASLETPLVRMDLDLAQHLQLVIDNFSIGTKY